MANKSKIKGNNAERELCQILSDELGGSFVLVPNSGAMVGGKNNHRFKSLSDTQGKIFRGDIIPPDMYPNLYIESKSYKDFRFHQLLQNSCPIIDEWINQTVEGSIHTDIVFICFKISRLGWFIIVTNPEHYVFDNFCNYKSTYITEMSNFLQKNVTKIKKLNITDMSK